ncbi:unnamed protein product [Caenorhabditis angaria]|uniref:Uncharacterized protein n=1 Tax=Caenorhabditis angaria TaxID=860376 RepID=A0A9P1IG91_9PELO|nr:unnamed protein product [Caenorhabditis angaria]
MLGFEKGTINVIRLSITFMLQFFAYMSQEFIQEPLIETISRNTNDEIDSHAGYNSFAIMYFFFTISCLFVTPVVERISAKWSMVLGILTYMIFQAGFLNLNPISLYISSGLLGVGSALTWIGQGKYLTENCTGSTIERNSSMMWVILKLSLLSGGIFLLYSFQHQTLIEVVQNETINYITILFLSIYFLALLNTLLLPLPAYQPKNRKIESFGGTLASTFKIMSTIPMSLLSIIFIYAGFSRSFWIAIYPTCIKFTSKLGENTTKLLAMSCISSGIGQVSSGFLMAIIGKNARKIGRDVILLIAVIIHLFVFFMIFLHFPIDAPLKTTDQVGLFAPSIELAMLSSLFLGFGDAIIQTQIYSFLCDGYSKESSHAFALFKFYSAASSTLAFFLSKYFTLPMHLALYSIFAVFSAFSAILAQRKYFYKIRHFQPDCIEIYTVDKK